MLRVVFDANVLIAALVTSSGTSAEALRRWADGEFELVVSATLLDETAAALAYPRLRKRVTEAEAVVFLQSLREGAFVAADPIEPFALTTADPDDDYLLALAAQENAILVSGDAHLLAQAGRAPVMTPRKLLDHLGA